MSVAFEVKDKHFLFLVGLVAVVSVVGIVTGYGGTDPSSVGHTPGEITGGEFGAGDYTFPGNVVVQNNLHASNVGITGYLDVGGNVNANNIGSVFIRWGNGEAPSGSTLLYSGYAFNGYISHASSVNTICIKSGDPATGDVGNGDLLYPSSTCDDSNGRIPPGIVARKLIKCAVCYAEGPTLEVWGSHTCPDGWTAAYRGYSMGSHYTEHATRERHCVESEYFDSGVEYSGSVDVWFATSIWATSNLADYSSYQNKHLKCAVCVKK